MKLECNIEYKILKAQTSRFSSMLTVHCYILLIKLLLYLLAFLLPLLDSSEVGCPAQDVPKTAEYVNLVDSQNTETEFSLKNTDSINIKIRHPEFSTNSFLVILYGANLKCSEPHTLVYTEVSSQTYSDCLINSVGSFRTWQSCKYECQCCGTCSDAYIRLSGWLDNVHQPWNVSLVEVAFEIMEDGTRSTDDAPEESDDTADDEASVTEKADDTKSVTPIEGDGRSADVTTEESDGTTIESDTFSAEANTTETPDGTRFVAPKKGDGGGNGSGAGGGQAVH